MKKVLIPNGSFHDIPLIKELKKMGYYVIASGANPNQEGYRYADKYIYGDFSIKEDILRIAQEEAIDYICSNCNDFGYITSCYVADEMGLSGHDSYETAILLHHKDKFKEWAKNKKIMTPRAEVFDNQKAAETYLEENTKYPIIIKPIDLGAGQGIGRADNVDEARVAIKNAISLSRTDKIVIEPFVEGTAHSFNAFIVNKKVVAYYSDNEYMKYDKYRVSTSASPADYAHITDDILINQTQIVAEKMNLSDGLVHSQYILDRYKTPHIIEITRRMSGDWYPYPESKATDIDWIHWIVKSELGLDCNDMECKKQKGFTGRHTLNGHRPGVVIDIHMSDKLKSHVYDSVYWFENGKYTIKNTKKDYPGIIFFSFENREEMMDILDNIDDHVSLVYE